MVLPSWSLRILLALLISVLSIQGQEQQQVDQICSADDGSCEAALCTDEKNNCLFWAERGECTNNPTFMAKNCGQSCEQCSGRLPDWEDPNCSDSHPKCEDWASRGECTLNPTYMIEACRKSCLICISVKNLREDGIDDDEILRRFRYTHGDWGPNQDVDGTDSEKVKVKDKLLNMKKYALEHVTTYPLEVRRLCNNTELRCSMWADTCESNLGYMMTNCALACHFCDMRFLYEKCKNDNPTNAWISEGGLKGKFEHLKSHGNPELLSGSEVKDQDDPWVLKWDDFATSQEADTLIAFAKSLPWEESTPISSGSLKETGFVRRLSKSAYCKDCGDTIYKKLQTTLSDLVEADPKYMEPLEFVHYDELQSFGMHHDFPQHDSWMPAGPRVLSIFLCLTDVPEGGAMGFPDLDWLSIPPKKGQLLIWQNVLSTDPRKRAKDMMSESLPVLKGEKYGIHTWVRLYDYGQAEKQSCV